MCKKSRKSSLYRQRRLCFGRFWFVCTSVSRFAYKVMNGFTCMKRTSEVYLGLKNNLINFGDDPDYDPDPGSGCDPYYTAEVCSL